MAGLGLRLFAAQLAAAGLGLLVLSRSRDDDGVLGLAFAAVTVCAALSSWLLTRGHARFIRQCAEALQAVANGEYGHRLWPKPGQALEELAQSVNAMASGIEAQISALEAEKLRMETVLGTMREGLMVLGEDGRILLMNKALEEAFPQAVNARGRRPIETVPCPELQTAAETILNWSDDTRPAVVTLQIEPGQDRFYDVSLVRPPKGRAGLGAVLVFHDLTEFKRLDKVRRDFVANVSHELRTPLTSIKGYAETLIGEKNFKDGVERRFLDVIIKNANHMARMVDELLSLARIENDRQPPVKTLVDAQEAFRAAQRECATLASERGIAVHASLPGQGPKVMADLGQLTQVFRNLLENAIKYGPENSIVTLTHRAGNADVTFCVEDMGPGVPEAERTRVFERFYRVGETRPDGPRAKGAKGAVGAGLGLAIAKHIVERHGGRIWIDDAREPMAGAAFCFSLPPVRDESSTS